MSHKEKLFPFTFTTETKDPSTGERIEKEFECQGTSYIVEHTGLSRRTVVWRAKHGLIPNAKRMGIGEKKRITYFWLTKRADEYIALVNSGQVKLGKIQTINPNQLSDASNDDLYEVTK